MPHQVLEQVVDNAAHLKDHTQQNAAMMDERIHLAHHNAAIMDKPLCLREEMAQLRADLLANPKTTAFPELQAQVQNLVNAIGQSHAPILKVNQPWQFKGVCKDVHEFLAHCDLNFATAPALFLTDNRKIIFVTSLLTGIAFKWYQALDGDPFTRFYATF
jgi:hypothetical protein